MSPKALVTAFIVPRWPIRTETFCFWPRDVLEWVVVEVLAEASNCNKRFSTRSSCSSLAGRGGGGGGPRGGGGGGGGERRGRGGRGGGLELVTEAGSMNRSAL